MLTDNSIVLNRLENAYLATIQTALTTDVLSAFQLKLLAEIDATQVKYVLLDFSGLELIDIDEFESIINIVNMASLMGVKSIFVGLTPGVVASIVDNPVDLTSLTCCLDIDEALLLVRGH